MRYSVQAELKWRKPSRNLPLKCLRASAGRDCRWHHRLRPKLCSLGWPMQKKRVASCCHYRTPKIEHCSNLIVADSVAVAVGCVACVEQYLHSEWWDRLWAKRLLVDSHHIIFLIVSENAAPTWRLMRMYLRACYRDLE